ncbi:hypothetical protein KY285_000520 [Solanum tuberosum]|nr:hypothetical protein KY285_000520 [Solanum tuberosum]
MAPSFFALFLSMLLLGVYQEAMAFPTQILDIPQRLTFNDRKIRSIKNILSTLQIGGRFDLPLLEYHNIHHFRFSNVFNDELIIRYPFPDIVHGSRKVLHHRHLIEAKGSISTNAPGSR